MKIPPFLLERFFVKHEFSAPYLMCSSDCESVEVGSLLDLEPNAREGLEKLWLGYTESQGSPTLREAISSLYQKCGPGDLLVHAGAQEAIYGFFNVTLERGDHVIVQWPCYQSLAQLPESLGCEVTRWEADAQNGWELDVAILKRSLKPKTKLVILNNPHNPTGYCLTREKFDEVVSLVEAHGALLFMDEVYKGLEYEPNTALPSACDILENAVSLGVMSKAFGLAGLRLGWVTTKNRRVLDAMAAFKDYTTICTSAPSEYLTALALRHKEKILGRNRELIRANLSLADRFFEKHSSRVAWHRPRAGCIAFAEIRGVGAERFSQDLLAATGVLVAPGSCFQYSDTHFRIGFGRKNFPDALARTDRFLETYES